MNISIIGLGKLGSCMAAVIAASGYRVIGVDIDKAAVKAINEGLAPVKEPELNRLIARNRGRLSATSNFKAALKESNITFVVVPTPSIDDGSFSLSHVGESFQNIGEGIKDKPGYHNVILTSTVLPGSTRLGLLPIIEKYSNKRCGRDFGLCYSPLFIALGSVIKNLLYPDFTLIGQMNKKSGDGLEKFYRSVVKNDSPCKRMSIENAEITKISLNSYVTTKLAFANMISDLCQNIPGGNVDVVTDALGEDSRIGPKYLTGGLGYGGPCFPRDNKAIGFIAAAVGSKADIAVVTDVMNRRRPEQLIATYQHMFPSGCEIAVLGLAYKPGTHILDDSQSLMLCGLLVDYGYRVRAYDPQLNSGVDTGIPELTVTATLTECLSGADVVYITTQESEFLALQAKDFAGNKNQPTVVIDCWRLLANNLPDHPEIIYRAPGYQHSDPEQVRLLQSLWRQRLME